MLVEPELPSVLDAPQEYRSRVKRRFLSQLDLSVTAKFYADVLKEVEMLDDSGKDL